MRILVTGAAGFIGSRLVEGLEQHGHHVWGMDLRPVPGRSQHAVGDVTDLLKVERVAESIGALQAIVHLAGPVVEQTRRHLAPSCQAQLIGTLGVLEACRRLGIPKVVLASSFYVYGGLPPEAVANEATVIDVDSLELFGAIKLMSERMVKAYAKSYGIEYVILRFGSVYGYNPLAGGSNVIRTFLEMGLRGEPIVIWGPGRRRNQYTLLEDIVEGAIAALAASNETFNLISPEETTTGELGLHLRERYGFDVVFDHDKPEGPSMAYMSSRKAQKQLGWRPTELEKGIEATMVALQGAGP